MLSDISQEAELEQIRLRTLLKEDSSFRSFFLRGAEITVGQSPTPWRLYVQAERGGKWARGDLPTFAKALTQVKLRLPDAWDMAIHSKPQHFKPPKLKKGKVVTWLPVPDGHLWCSLCRRPTVFRTFNKHPALKYGCSPEEKRCTICGVRKENLRSFPSQLSWPAVSG